MFDNFGHFFKKVVKQEPVEEIESKSAAKERLQLVLMQDRANVSADFLELMKKEIIDVVKKYIIVDEETIDVRLTTQVNEDGTNGEPTLYANIPIVNIRNELKAEHITDQINFADLIEEQAKQEAEKLEEQENKQLFNMSDTQRTVIIDDETLEKVNSELITTKEREAKLEEKAQKKEAKREEGRRVKQVQEENKEQEEKVQKEVEEQVHEEPKIEVKEVKETKIEEKAKVKDSDSVVSEEAKEEVIEKEEPQVKAEVKKQVDTSVSTKSSQGRRVKTEDKNEEKAKLATEDLKKSIEDEIAELDDLEKELFSNVNESDENDEEDEDFVTFDDLYAKAQEEDKKKEKKNK